MADVLSHPFRIVGGDVATVADGSEQANIEAVAVTAMTRKGERPLVPEFGVIEPVFDELDVAELNAVLATFGPDVTVAVVDVTYPDDLTELVTITIDED